MTRPSRLRAFGWIALVAVLITVPLFFVPMQSRDSWPIDVNWISHFSEQLKAGYPYPRWLPQSNGGSGAPVFYFYAPLPFYIGAIPMALGIPPYAAVAVTFALASFAMGVAMLHWLEGSQRPLAGTILFMLLPYTLFDFYWRAAIGEYWGIVFVPLIAIALRDRRVVMLAASYAALLYAHLPFALLVSVFFIAPYGLYLVARDGHMGRVTPYAAALATGLLMAALYIVPALTLQDHINVAWLHDHPHNQPTSWLMFENPMEKREFGLAVYGLAALLLGALVLLFRGQRLVAGYGLAMLAVITLGYGIWSLPLLDKVQFPWRAFPLVGFAIATAYAWSDEALRRRAAALLMGAGSLAAVLSLDPDPIPITLWTDPPLEVPEYLPPDAPWQEGNAITLWAAEQEGIFYFPSLGTSSDGMFLDGEPELRMLAEEKIGLAISLVGLALFLALWRARGRWNWLAPLPAGSGYRGAAATRVVV